MLEETIAQRLSELLQERGWSGYRLAQRCEVSQNSIYNVLRGRGSIELDTLSKICDTLEISLQEFFDLDGREGYHLTEMEREHLADFRALDPTRRDLVMAYTRGLLIQSGSETA